MPPDSFDLQTEQVNRPSHRAAAAGSHGTSALGRTPSPRSTPPAFPQPGEPFCGFELVSELGRGGMGRVFLARQPNMGGRAVVLKVGQMLSGECQKLARLQHPNVVPVYSFHQSGAMQAVCMPYRGPLTLAHLVSRLQTEDLPTLSGQALTTVIADCRRTREKGLPATTPAVQPAADPPAADRPLVRLRALNFIDAILTLVRDIAHGLRFAHGEGIVHSDLKPANVIIAEDGSPQLIDFGIAYDRSARGVSELVIGGTRPYSSPEQLGSILQASVEHDHRTDLYSLGVVAYELTTGRLPFAPNYDPSDEAIAQDRAGRFTPPRCPRLLNKRVPPAVAAVIGKCLAANPADRYQTADELIEDVDRQLARRPLKHAPNPSPGELVTKWVGRNRWLIAAGVAAGVVGGGYAAFASHSSKQTERLMRAEAAGVADGFERDARKAQSLLGAANADAAALEAGIHSGEQALAPHGVLEHDRWWEEGTAAKLPPEQVTKLRVRAAGVLMDMSRSAGVRSQMASVLADRGRWQAKAKEWNARAEAAFPDGATVRGVWTQRAWLCRLGGDAAGAKAAADTAAALPLATALDFRTEGRELLEQGHWQQAGEHLTRAFELDPSDYWASFALGLAYYRRGDDTNALVAFDTCVALDPAVAGGHFNRGSALLRSFQFKKAEDDFTRVIDTRPDWPEAYLNRASCREAQGLLAEAVTDLTKALDLGYPPTAVRLARSRVYARLKEDALAEADLTAGLKETPTNERGWVARGVQRMPRDPSGGVTAFADALADFDQALALNPRSITALQCKARCYSLAGESRRAAAVLTDLLAQYPEWLDALSGRAVQYARLGERAKAHADAEAGVRLGEWKPATAYQLAGVYATTSKTHPEDKREAFRLLASALRSGFGYAYLDEDRELDPLRSDAEFSRVVEESRVAFEKKAKQ